MPTPDSPCLTLTPVEVAARLRHESGLVFFDSAVANSASVSRLGWSPGEVISGASPADWRCLSEKVKAAQLATANRGDGPTGFAAGFVNYDGDFTFGFYEQSLIYSHAEQKWRGSAGLPERAAEPAALRSPTPPFRAKMGNEEFCVMVRRAQDYIAAGDIYQVNLSREFSAPWTGDAWTFYRSLRESSPAPYAAFLDLGGRAVLSSSPELFLQMKGRNIQTRPIKGTRPRRFDATADRQSAHDLVTSPKERAELVMITDLERNDLGQICEYGSVEVLEIAKLESYEQVFHLASTVAGRLRAEVDHVAALRSCFPGGSITGAPKRRAREIIAELEPVPRGLYTGAIGYFGYNGESQFSIAIRTVVIEKNAPQPHASFHVGAGIVADSVAEQEFQETQDKAAGILLAAARL